MQTQDRRGTPRCVITWPLYTGPQTAERFSGMVVNVSRSGLLFLSSERYQVGDLVEMEIGISPLLSHHSVVRIVREEPGEAGQWAYGAEFLTMLEEDRVILHRTLLEFLHG